MSIDDELAGMVEAAVPPSPLDEPGTELVELVARALVADDGDILRYSLTWDTLVPQGRNSWRATARAVLAAIEASGRVVYERLALAQIESQRDNARSSADMHARLLTDAQDEIDRLTGERRRSEAKWRLFSKSTEDRPASTSDTVPADLARLIANDVPPGLEHLCPGCAARILVDILACGSCSRRMPDRLLHELTGGASGDLAFARAKSEALDWFAAHPVTKGGA